ncbi:hypothetical protein BGW38_008333 [Lunasporangiospora selenospora]|uniref:Ion transport domain-containing protein n=1 Tax=Lunasporangiospora selenospora TaxID=979761 RepID=A0A9P6G052_9FUNG|nr:hypothetical protein BGW38_008333 [Lunasporangiospora selenospora]
MRRQFWAKVLCLDKCVLKTDYVGKIRKQGAIKPIEKLYNIVVCLYFECGIGGIDYIGISGDLKKVSQVSLSASTQFARVLLRPQIEWSKLEVSVTYDEEYKDPAPVQLCYVERSLDGFKKGMFDCILPVLPVPRESINVLHLYKNNSSPPCPAKILNYEISATGSRACTLSEIGGKLHLDLWELDIGTATKRSQFPYPSSKPISQLTVDKSNDNCGEYLLAISWDGSQIFFGGTQGSSVPNRLYRLSDSQLIKSDDLKDCPVLATAQSRVGFTGTELNDVSQRFVVISSGIVYVWSTGSKWEMLHSAPVVNSPPPLSDLFTNMVARDILILQASDQKIVVWSIDKKRELRTITTMNRIESFLLSTNGRTVAVSTLKGSLLYSTQSEKQFYIPKKQIKNGQFLNGSTNILQTEHSGEFPQKFSILDSSSLSCEMTGTFLSGDGKIRVHNLNPDSGKQGQALESTLLSYVNGSVLEMSFVEEISVAEGDTPDSRCKPECTDNLQKVPELGTPVQTLTFKKVVKFGKTEYVTIPKDKVTLTVRRSPNLCNWELLVKVDFNDGVSKSMSLVADRLYFLEKRLQLVTVMDYPEVVVSVWSLPKTSNEEIEMPLFWSLGISDDPSTIWSCRHERVLTIKRDDKFIPLKLGRACSPENAKYFFGNGSRLFNSYLSVCSTPNDSTAGAIIRYLSSHVNKNPRPSNNRFTVISSLLDECQGIEGSTNRVLEDILKADPENHWIPLRQYTVGTNPIEILIQKSQKDSTAEEAMRTLIGYCVEMARKEKGINYLEYLCEPLEYLVACYPDIALQVARGFAYVPYADPNEVLTNATIVHPPSFRRLFCRDKRPIHKCRNPILQMKHQKAPSQAHPLFKEDIFVAPVSLLWDSEMPPPSEQLAWYKIIYQLVELNVTPVTRVKIRLRRYDNEILDNPAIEALIRYKWNSFAYLIWLGRFAIHIAYYALIMLAASLQIYFKNPYLLVVVFCGIICLGNYFIWLIITQIIGEKCHEIFERDRLQTKADERMAEENKTEERRRERRKTIVDDEVTLSSPLSLDGGKNDDGKNEGDKNGVGMDRRTTYKILKENFRRRKDPEPEISTLTKGPSPYLRAPYNKLDLAMYILPVLTSIHQILRYCLSDYNGISWDLSLCVILVLLHFLTELRVSETFSQYTTFVFDVLNQIQAFFVILVGVVMIFTLAILHTIYGSTLINSEGNNGGIPKHYFGGFTTVFLMMGGRYDPLADNLFNSCKEDSPPNCSEYKNWSLIIMVTAYYFFTSILMLNMLMALVLQIGAKGSGKNWHQVWLEERLRYVAIAENISYQIPGIRQMFGGFPDEIYYTATPQQVREYWQRIRKQSAEADPDYDKRDTTTKTTVSDMAKVAASLWMRHSGCSGENEGTGGPDLGLTGHIEQQAQQLNDIKASLQLLVEQAQQGSVKEAGNKE